MIRLEPKRAGERRDYKHDWTAFLGTDTIASQQTASDEVTVVTSGKADEDRSVTFTLSGGTAGTVARVTQTITTAIGNIETEVFTIPIVSADEPVSVAEAKAHLRVVDNDSEDAVISEIVASARQWVEDYTGQVLIRRPVELTFDAWGDYLTVFARPVVSVSSIFYTDEAGDEQEFEGFAYSSGQYPLRLSPVSEFPTLGNNGTITVTLTAGYAEGECPEPLRHAIKVMLTAMFKNRGGPWDDAEKAARSLCKAYRAPGMA